MKLEKKYFINVGRGTLHINGCKKCYNAQHPPIDAKYFETMDEVLKAEALYTKRCKLCFRNQ